MGDIPDLCIEAAWILGGKWEKKGVAPTSKFGNNALGRNKMSGTMLHNAGNPCHSSYKTESDIQIRIKDEKISATSTKYPEEL